MSNNTSNFTIPHTGGDAGTLSGIESILGPSLIGALLSMVLWGVTSSQTYDYFMNNTDRLFQRSIVFFLWILDTTTSVMDFHFVYRQLVTNYANPAGSFTLTWSSTYHLLVGGLINFTIRAMYARRIYHLSGKNIALVTWIMVFSFGEFVVYIVTTIIATHRKVTDGLQIITLLMYLTFGFGVTADLSVTVALCWLLHSAKSGFRRSDSMINILIIYIVNTGFLVTLDAALILILYIAVQKNQVYFAFLMLQHKLYVNAYLACLNARGRIRERGSSLVSLSRLDLSYSTRRSTQQGGGSDQKPTHVDFLVE